MQSSVTGSEVSPGAATQAKHLNGGTDQFGALQMVELSVRGVIDGNE